jgi:hypothetical protein
VSDEQHLIRIVVTAPHKHGGRWRRIGDDYWTTEANANDLAAIGHAVRKPEAQPSRYERRDLRPKKAKPEPDPQRYERRDLRPKK